MFSRTSSRISLVLALWTLFLGCAQAPASSRFVSDEGGFSIDMPGKVQERVEPLVSELGPMTLHAFLVDQGRNGVFGVTYSDYPQDYVDENSADIVLDGSRDGSVASIAGTLVSETPTSYGEFPGRIRAIEFGGGEAMHRGRVFLVGRRLYQVMWAGPKAKSKAKEIDRFFESFALEQQGSD